MEGIEKPNILQGENYEDERGLITSLNKLTFNGIERVYFIKHPDESVIRGWHGHQFERKWFYVVQGEFRVATVRIDNWESPSTNLSADIFNLSDQRSEVLQVPAGYANCIKSQTKDGILMVLSDKTYPECLSDSWRYYNTMWVKEW